MIKVKSLFDAVEADDGARLWVEPIGLTRDLAEWCQVDHLLSNVAPPKKLSSWFEEHPDSYDDFRGRYHDHLSRSQHREALEELAKAAVDETYTLLHTGDDPEHNAAIALAEYLVELQGWAGPA
jgi:uncharacterized protein YeaO (DUF488 family)